MSSENLVRKETWSVNIRTDTGDVSEVDVVFLQYHDTIDASLIQGDADTEGLVVALFDSIVVNGDPDPITGILVAHFPDDATDPQYLGLCQALTKSPLPTVFGATYSGYDLEKLRDDANAYAAESST